MVRVFITGATGFVGGEALAQIAAPAGKHEISCLLRDKAKAPLVQAAYPQVRIVIGDLDDSEIIKQESRAADVVFNLASTGHLGAASAVAAGLTDPAREKPGHWIQISGGSLFSGPDVKQGRFGEGPERSFDDLDGVSDILATILGSPARAVDNLVISQDPSKVRTALIVGPLIYGTGTGPGNQRSVQAPEIARVTLEQKRGFRLGAGRSVWSNVHVRDLGAMLVALLDAAAAGKQDGLWNREGIYTPENGSLAFGDLASLVAAEAHSAGYIESPAVEWSITPEEANSFTSHGAVLWGTNAVSKASRARQQLGWKPQAPTVQESIPEVVKLEADRRKQK